MRYDESILQGGWDEVKGKLKEKYNQLTDDDLGFVEGKEDELLGRLQNRLGKSKEELQRELESLSKLQNGEANAGPKIKTVDAARLNRRRTKRDIECRILISVLCSIPMLLLIFLWRGCS
jgi:uncharacterized protein YjbJ (UPF0337 family)